MKLSHLYIGLATLGFLIIITAILWKIPEYSSNQIIEFDPNNPLSREELIEMNQEDRIEYFEQKQAYEIRKDIVESIESRSSSTHTERSHQTIEIRRQNLYDDYPEFVEHHAREEISRMFYFFIANHKTSWNIETSASSIYECDYSNYSLDKSQNDYSTHPCDGENLYKRLDLFSSKKFYESGKSLIDKRAHIVYGKYSDASRIRDKLVKSNKVE